MAKDKDGVELHPGDAVMTDGLWISMFVSEHQPDDPEFIYLHRGPAREVVSASEVTLHARAIR